MKAAEIESLATVQEATHVLQMLEHRGLKEPAIASGWTRGFLTDIEPSDIDIAYVGPVAPEDAQQHLRDVLGKLSINPDPWDINGIWNAELAYGVQRTVENYLLYYVNSIDTVYLATDGKLHDPTGYGFADAAAKVLRLNTYDSKNGRTPTASEEVYVCLEGCRRIAKFGWTPTPASIHRIQRGVARWQALLPAEQDRFVHKKIIGKYAAQQRSTTVRSIYERYGWGFVFDLATFLEGNV
jgi:hypothetical protein